MISTSSAWKTYAQNSSVFKVKATMTGGSTLNLTDEDFVLGTVQITDSISGMNEISLGAVVTNSFSATLNNASGKFDNWDWNQIEVYFGVNNEWILRGTYLIDRPTSIGETIQIKAYDYMDKLNKYFSGMSVAYPINSSTLIQNICTYCGVTWGAWNCGTTYNVNLTGLVDESTTCRQVVSWILETVAGYARINPTNNKLYCKTFAKGSWGSADALNGGAFSAWNTGDVADGGTMSPWSVVADKYGGLIADGDYSIEKIKQLNVYIDDVEVTGVRAYTYNTVDEFDFSTAGSAGYIIALQGNPIINSSNNSAIASRAWANLYGFRVRPFNATIFGDPSIEAGDCIGLTDSKGNHYMSVITNLTYVLCADMRISCDAETISENAIEVANPSTQTIAGAVSAAYDYIAAKKISADYIDAGTITASVVAKNLRMEGGELNVTASGQDTAVITLDWANNYFEDQAKLSPQGLTARYTSYMGGTAYRNCQLSGTSLAFFQDEEYTGNNAQILLNQSLAGAGKGTFTGSVTASSFINSSKEEIKRDIEKADSALSKVLDADILAFNYKNESKGAKQHIGLAIGEKYSTPSEIIAEDDEGNETGVDLYAMVSMAWKAIQEQQEQIETLQKEVATLKEQINGNSNQKGNERTMVE